MHSRYLKPAICATPLLAVAASAVAQVGTMDYGPDTVAPVPVGGGVFLVIMGILLGVTAYRKISRNGAAGNTSASVFLLIGAAAFTLTGGQVLQQAYATAATPLSNPAGGTVDIFPGYQEYENTSGSPLRITAINILDCPETAVRALAESAIPECSPGSTVLETGEICSTNYLDCGLADRITSQAGYFWVRADYRAPESDHAAVCAEFGLAATTKDVTLTWDATLLETLSTAFGYLSNGDDNDAAPSMWCWDGDGGPSPTPAGYCETHSFGDFYQNYGYWGDDPDIRPVFTCMTPPA